MGNNATFTVKQSKSGKYKGQYKYTLNAGGNKLVPSEYLHNTKDLLASMKNLSKNAEQAWKRYQKEIKNASR